MNEFVDTTNIKRLSFSQFLGTFGIQTICIANIRQLLEVDRISASVSVSAPNVDKWALSANIRFRPKAVSVQFLYKIHRELVSNSIRTADADKLNSTVASSVGRVYWAEVEMDQWVMGQMGHCFWMGHVGH